MIKILFFLIFFFYIITLLVAEYVVLTEVYLKKCSVSMQTNIFYCIEKHKINQSYPLLAPQSFSQNYLSQVNREPLSGTGVVWSSQK